MGPGGVVAVNTKFTRFRVQAQAGGVVRVDGYPAAWVTGAADMAVHVQGVLAGALRVQENEVPVVGVVCVWCPHPVEGGNPALARGEELFGWVRALPPVWGPGDVGYVFGVARRVETWLGTG